MGDRTYQVTVAQAAVLLMGYSKDRTMYQITTPASNNIYISPDPTITALNGYRIPPNSQFPQDTGQRFDPHGPLYAISDAGNNQVGVWESIGYTRETERQAER